MFYSKACRDNIINHRNRDIVHFRDFQFCHGFVIRKASLRELRVEGVYKLFLTSTLKRCESILTIPESLKGKLESLLFSHTSPTFQL